MTAELIVRIEKMLDKDREAREREYKFFTETLRRKYCKNGECLSMSMLNPSERETLDKVSDEARETTRIYSEFISTEF